MRSQQRLCAHPQKRCAHSRDDALTPEAMRSLQRRCSHPTGDALTLQAMPSPFRRCSLLSDGALSPRRCFHLTGGALFPHLMQFCRNKGKVFYGQWPGAHRGELATIVLWGQLPTTSLPNAVEIAYWAKCCWATSIAAGML